MMMWFMDTIYKMVVSQHIYIYIILYSTGSVPFRGLTKHVWMLPDFAASGKSQDRDGSKLIVPSRWRSPSSWYSVSTTQPWWYVMTCPTVHINRLRLDLLSISKYLRSRWAWPQDVGIYGGKRISGAAAAVWLLSLSSQFDRWVRSPEVTSNSPPCSTAFPQVFPIGSII